MAKKKSAKKPAKTEHTLPVTNNTAKEELQVLEPPATDLAQDEQKPIDISNDQTSIADSEPASSNGSSELPIKEESIKEPNQKVPFPVIEENRVSISERHKSDRAETDETKNVNESLGALKIQLEQTEAERDEIQEEYDSLLEKVTTIKQRLGERFKELEAEAAKAKAETEQIRRSSKAELDDRLEKAQKESEKALSAALADAKVHTREVVRKEMETQSNEEVEKVRAELKKVKEDLSRTQKEASTARELQVSQKIMFDQEIANERVSKQTLEVELEQLNAKFDSNSSVTSQLNHTCELQEQEIAKLKRKTHAAEEAYKNLQVKYNTELSEVSKARDEATKELNALHTQLASQTQLSASSKERQLRLETEAKENQLLIGKLRHEAVILNDHLTHALRLVRKDSEGSTVDKELVSNLFVQFATCPRQDTKKFEILLLIANFLGWDEQRRKIVGLEKENPDLELQNQLAQNPPQMVGMVGKLAEFLENRRNNGK